MDEGNVVSCKPVVARRHPTTLLDFVEEPFDEVASAIEVRAKADRIASIAFRRDVGPRALLHGKLPDPVGVIATVGKLGINLSKLEVAVESEGDNRGILGLDNRISACMSGLRTTVQITADNAGAEQLEELVRWSDRHSPVGCTVREAPKNTLVVRVT